MKTMHYDEMRVQIFDSPQELGRAAADDLAEILKATIAARGKAAIILATGNSQLAFLHALGTKSGISWDQVVVLQMDEYLGIPASHPASFRRFHRQHLVDAAHPKAFFGIEGDALDPEVDRARVAETVSRLGRCTRETQSTGCASSAGGTLDAVLSRFDFTHPVPCTLVSRFGFCLVAG